MKAPPKKNLFTIEFKDNYLGHSLFIKFSTIDKGRTPSLIQKYVDKKNDKQIREIKYR